LQQCVIRAINIVIGGKDGFIKTLQQNIATVLSEVLDHNTVEIDAKLDDLQKELLHLANSGNQYMGVAEDICRLREKKQSALSQNSDRQTKRQRISEMKAFLNSQTGIISQYDDRLVRRLVEQVTVHEGRVVVEFRSGEEIEVPYNLCPNAAFSIRARK
jgi:site-specific DNA recombinase